MRSGLAIILSLAAAVAPAAEAAATVNPRPATIPAVQQWTGAEGSFALRAGSRIVVDQRDRRALMTEARTLAADLGRLAGREPRIVVRRLGGLRRGDVHLRLGSRDEQLGEEGYRLSVGRTVRILARTDAGAFYGTRTLLQLVRSGRVPRGRARDWPRYPDRGLMVDNGRKYFTPAWIERRIRELAYLKLNRLHLHLSDNQGFRIESETHPEIVTAPYLKKDDVRQILRVARRYHVTVVPEIDMPGHMEAALKPHPELQLKDAAGNASADKLDVTLPAARQFARDLIEEYLGLFPGPFWHGGADEYFFPVPEQAGYAAHPQLERYAQERYGPNATGKDAFLGFINWMNDVVRSRGRTLRIWHDGLGGGSAVTVAPNVIVEWWSDHAGPEPQALVDAGHQVLNGGWYPTYYVNGPLGAVKPDMRSAYESWEVNQFYGPLVAGGGVGTPAHTLAPDEPANRGSLLHVWNDDPEAATEDETAHGIAPRLRVLAQKTWSSPPVAATYAEFERVMEATGSSP